MRQIKMKNIISLLEGGAKSIPRKGDVFVMHMKGIGYIPGLVVKDNFKYGQETLLIIYLYNCISDKKETKFDLIKGNLIVNPSLVTAMDWRSRGGFENIYAINEDEMDIYQNHCFYDDLRESYIDENDAACHKFEPCGLYAISNIGAEAISIFEKINPDVQVIE